jgi:hypothetical protein
VPEAGGARQGAGSLCTGRELTAATVATIALLAFFYAFGTERAGLLKDDAGQYVRMAESPQYLARLPYTFRVLSPLLAGAVPGGSIGGFVLVTLVSLGLACIALYLYERAVGLGHLAALAGASLFAVSGGSIRMLTTPTYVDAATYLSEAVAFLSLATGRYWAFLAAVTVGALNRETALLLAPLYAFATPRAERRAGRIALAILLPGAVLAGLLFVKLAAGGVLSGVPLATIAPAPQALQQNVPTLTQLFDLFSSFGALWLLAAMNLPGPTPFLRQTLIFGGLLIFQLVVARGDEGRVLSHLFPIVIPLAMLEVERTLRDSRSLAIVLVLACAASMVHARWVVLEPTAPRYALVAVGTVVALGIVLLRQYSHRIRRPSVPRA